MKRVLLLLALGLAGCIPHRPPAKAKSPIATALAVVYDGLDTTRQEEVVGGVPSEVTAAIVKELADRNLTVEVLPPDRFEKLFRTHRISSQRMESLAGLAPEAELYVLVETRAEFYSQMNGRYRWTVNARISMARKGALEAGSSRQISEGAFLDYDHEREPDALKASRHRIGDVAGRLAEDFLGL